jgi:hypothetical protein
VSLSDTFASENIYSFIVHVMLKHFSKELIIHNSENEEVSSFGSAEIRVNSTSYSKD